MPLTLPEVKRDPIHTRAIECRSFVREDGTWDIEGHLTDVKAYPFHNDHRGTIEAGEPFHDMWIRLTVDADFVIRDVETVMDATPFALCPDIVPAFDQLKGLRIGPGWNRRVMERLGGVKGCAHLVDLLRPIATVAFHTVQWSRAAPNRQKDTRPAKPPIDACHAWRRNGPVVREKWPEYYSES